MKKRFLFVLLTLLLALSCATLFACGEAGVKEEVSLDQSAVQLKAGTEMTVQVQATTKAKAVSFVSSDEAVFTVQTAGKTAVVSPVAEGTAVLTASTGTGDTLATATCKVTVTAADNLPVILFDKATMSLRCSEDPDKPGEGEGPGELTAQVSGYDGEVTYSSSLEIVATIAVEGNKVTVKPEGEGPTVVTASFVVDGITYSTKCNVNVRAAKARLAWWNAAGTQKIGIDTPMTSAFINVSDHVYHGVPALTSSDPTVATISQVVGAADAAGNYTFFLTFLKKGETTLKAVVTDAIDGETTTITFRLVVNGPDATIALNPSNLEIELGAAPQTVTAAVAHYKGEVKFTNSNDDAATIAVDKDDKKKFVVTPVALGTTTVTAKFTDGDAERTATCTVTVKPASQIAFPTQNMTVDTGSDPKAPRTITLNYTKKAGDPAISFETGDSSIATVTAGGEDNATATIVPVAVGKTTLSAKLGTQETKTIDLEVSNGGITYTTGADAGDATYKPDKGIHVSAITAAVTGTLYIPDYFYDAASKTYLPVTRLNFRLMYEAYDGGDDSKNYSKGITSVSLGKNLVSYGTRALAKLPAVCTEVDFSRLTVKTVTGNQLFYGSFFTSFVIPDDVVIDGIGSFQNTALTELTISKAMTSLSAGWLQCSPCLIEKIFIPKSITEMAETSISDPNGATEDLKCTFYFEGTQEEWEATKYAAQFAGNANIKLEYNQTGIPQA